MAAPSSKIPLAVLGATGLVGQRMVALTAEHPWFELTELAASGRSAGRRYGDVVRWRLPGAPPPAAADLVVRHVDPGALGAPVVLSALDAAVAGPVEDALADAGRAVITNARSHRFDADAPLVVPEVNPEHLALVGVQRRRRPAPGFIAANPNCTAIALTLALAPFQRAVGVRRAVVTTFQAASGAGHPGVPALELLDNVIPFIDGEEEKISAEPGKIFGRLEQDRVVPAALTLSVHVHRAPVVDGHLLSISVELEHALSPAEATELLASFRAAPQELRLPSAPTRPLVVLTERDRPQPRLDRMAGGGMAVVIGQVRACPVLGLRLEALSHNTIRGAAGGALLLAELAAAQGLLM